MQCIILGYASQAFGRSWSAPTRQRRSRPGQEAAAAVGTLLRGRSASALVREHELKHSGRSRTQDARARVAIRESRACRPFTHSSRLPLCFPTYPPVASPRPPLCSAARLRARDRPEVSRPHIAELFRRAYEARLLRHRFSPLITGGVIVQAPLLLEFFA